jgi:hypothetical protein
MSNVSGILRGVFRGCYQRALSLASRPINRELAHRDSQRGGGKLRWFTPEEAEVAAALANVIVPSDEETPDWTILMYLAHPQLHRSTDCCRPIGTSKKCMRADFCPSICGRSGTMDVDSRS